MSLNRPTRIQTFIGVAHIFAKRATCMRRNVGAVVVQQRTVVGHGYNGPPSGEPHCTGNDCPGKHFCKLTIHAEKNALVRAGRLAKHGDLYTTDSPCIECARLSHSAGINRVFFEILYRDSDPLNLLRDWGVKVYQVLPAGYVMDWDTREIVELEV
jgi:dCMP deaminase